MGKTDDIDPDGSRARDAQTPFRVPEDVAAPILEWLSNGGALAGYCRQDGVPGRSTIHDWRAKDPEFRARYKAAQECCGEALMDQAQEVADDGRNDWMEQFGKDGESMGWKLNGEHVQRSKLRVDVLQRRAACHAPHLFGTKIALGGDRDAPPIKIENGDVPELPRGEEFRSFIGKFFAVAADQGMLPESDDGTG